jgi:hypothetical protein
VFRDLISSQRRAQKACFPSPKTWSRPGRVAVTGRATEGCLSRCRPIAGADSTPGGQDRSRDDDLIPWQGVGTSTSPLPASLSTLADWPPVSVFRRQSRVRSRFDGLRSSEMRSAPPPLPFAPQVEVRNYRVADSTAGTGAPDKPATGRKGGGLKFWSWVKGVVIREGRQWRDTVMWVPSMHQAESWQA